MQILAHINAVDSYELLVVKLGEPVLSVVHHVPTQVAIMVNRALVLVAAVYELSTMQAGDRMIIPCCVLVVGAIVSICRLTRIEKVQKCLTRVQ